MSSQSETKSKFKHLNSNVYQIQTKEKVLPKPLITSHVLKAGSFNLNEGNLPASPAVHVEKYVPSHLSGSKVVMSSNSPSMAAIEDMKKNLKNLNDLQARLRFVLKELEELVHE